MGLHLIDNLGLSELAAACAEEQPLGVPVHGAARCGSRATGSPVNPVAVF